MTRCSGASGDKETSRVVRDRGEGSRCDATLALGGQLVGRVKSQLAPPASPRPRSPPGAGAFYRKYSNNRRPRPRLWRCGAAGVRSKPGLGNKWAGWAGAGRGEGRDAPILLRFYDQSHHFHLGLSSPLLPARQQRNVESGELAVMMTCGVSP